MLRKTRWNQSKALSPYAQALKHIALRGASALGPSAREMELSMYRANTLAVDYRPPAHGKWDDTIERWAYAWQYPAEEKYEDAASFVMKNDNVMRRLIDFAHKLNSTPPSERALSGQHSLLYPPLLEETSAPLQSPYDNLELTLSSWSAENQQSVQSQEKQLQNCKEEVEIQNRGEEEEHDEYEAIEHAACEIATSLSPEFISEQNKTFTLQQQEEESEDEYKYAKEEKQLSTKSTSTVLHAMKESILSDAIHRLQIPLAYIDDQSERTNASKEFCVIVEDAGVEYTSDGIIIILSALARQQYYHEARTLFVFCESIQFDITAETYKALMKYDSCTGEVNHAMSLIEEMKSKGITPRIGNWHELMKTFITAGDVGAVHQIVDNMKMYGNIEPNEVTFAIQLRALAKDVNNFNALAEAIQLFDQMENVHGFIPSRSHYNALMHALSYSPSHEMRLRCEELAQKMDLMGLTWDGLTYLNLIRSSQVIGDVERVEYYLSKMRNDGVEITMIHLAWAIHARVQCIIRHDYSSLEHKHNELIAFLMKHIDVALEVYQLIVKRGWQLSLPFVNALLLLWCQATIVCMEHLPNELIVAQDFNHNAEQMWNSTFDEWGLRKDVFSYECYITLLARQQKIDEAEKIFQEMNLNEDLVPNRRTYEQLILMHLASGEEGGASRALFYLDAMERCKLSIKASFLRKMVRINNSSNYKRDMKRRARRIMEAREEYLARKQESEMGNFTTNQTHDDYTEKDNDDEEEEEEDECTESVVKQMYEQEEKEGSSSSSSSSNQEHDDDDDRVNKLKPLPINPNSTLAWWEKWKRESISKHELFETENADGTPRGETMEDKNEALVKLGLRSPTPETTSSSTSSSSSEVMTIEDAPPNALTSIHSTKHVSQHNQNTNKDHSLLNTLREQEGEVTGALWGLDGGELSYPKDGGGPHGWGVRLWRDRAIMQKEFNKVIDGKIKPPGFTPMGITSRTMEDQWEIEQSQSRNSQELSDWRQFPESRYDDNTAKPQSEIAHKVDHAGELIWQAEEHDALSPYKTNEELALEEDNTFYNQLGEQSREKTKELITALQDKKENEMDIIGKGHTRRSKYDYLRKWREMYQHGTLEVPSNSVIRYGRDESDAEYSASSTIREWYARNKQSMQTSEERVKLKKIHQHNKEKKRAKGITRSKRTK